MDSPGALSHLGVYPRVGGGTFLTWYATPRYMGLSPRGRGNRLRPAGAAAGVGSIPAWAGEPGGAGWLT